MNATISSSRLAILTVFGCLGFFPMAGCGSAPARPALDSYYRSAPAPAWHDMPLSWSKLDRIQDWLDGSGPERWPDALPGAELELAQGRLELAIQESSRMPSSIIAARLDRAESGFQRVLALKNSSSSQRSAANAGLNTLRSSRGSVPVASPGGIIQRSAWGARAPDPRSLNPSLQPWQRITVHHSATALESNDLGSSALAIQKIQKEHMARPVSEGSRQTWGDIGYHFLIDPSGRVFQGRSMTWKGAHAGNSGANVANIGICLLGNFNAQMPTSAAMGSLEKLIADLSRRHGIGSNKIFGHQDFKSTDCPGTRLMSWVRSYAAPR